jgi:hypothetical protein
MVASISMMSSERIENTAVCSVVVKVRDADTNSPVYLAVVTVAWASNNATRGMPTADVAYTDRNGVFKSKSKRISLVPGAGCSVRLISVDKPNYTLLTPQLALSKPLP